MNQPTIHDLLTELAEPIETRDIASGVWDAALRRRHRRRVVVGATVAVGAVVVAGGTAIVRGDDGGEPRGGQAATHGPTSASPSADAMLGGFPVWTAPRVLDEATLPHVPSRLPGVINLTDPNPSVVEAPIDGAIAAFGISKITGNTTNFDGVMLVSFDGELRHLDTPSLHPVINPTGDPFLPFGAGSLSPDGTKIAFVQTGGVAVYNLPTNEWTRWFDILPVGEAGGGPSWTADGLAVRVGNTTLDVATGQVTSDRIGSPLYSTGLAIEQWWGAERTAGDEHARAVSYLNEQVDIPGVESNPPAVIAVGDVSGVLVMPDQQYRWKGCCTAAGWLDDHTLAYDSTSGGVEPAFAGQVTHVLAWDVTTGEVGRVSSIFGSADMLFSTSYSDLGPGAQG